MPILGRTLATLEKTVFSLLFSPDGQWLYSGTETGNIQLWQTTDFSLVQTLNAHENAVTALSSWKTLLASADADGQVRLWHTDGQSLGEPLIGHQQAVTDLAFTQDGRFLLSSGEDGQIIIWQVLSEGLAKLTQLRGEHEGQHNSKIHSLALSNDARLLMSMGDESLVFWDSQTWKPIIRFLFEGLSHDHPGGFQQLFWYSDKQQLLAIRGWQIMFWDVLKRQTTASLRYEGMLHSAAFSPNQKYVAAGTREKVLALWDIETQTRLGNDWRGHKRKNISGSGAVEEEIHALAFSPDNRYLVSGGADGRIILWPIDAHWWAAQACQLVGRDITPEEWQQWLGDLDYQALCSTEKLANVFQTYPALLTTQEVK